MRQGTAIQTVPATRMLEAPAPAGREVALFAIKGLPTAEIAGPRQTSAGTVKARMAAVCRRPRLWGRPRLPGLFIEDLMRHDSPPCRHALPAGAAVALPSSPSGARA